VATPLKGLLAMRDHPRWNEFQVHLVMQMALECLMAKQFPRVLEVLREIDSKEHSAKKV